MKNRLVVIGYVGIMKCYLNVSDRDAIQRYITEEEISETEFETNTDIKFKVIEFVDSFDAYDVWKN